MLKYVDTAITLLELPDEVTLCINLSNCPCHCKGCHSSYLAEDIGEILTATRLEKLIKKNDGITAVCFMGGDNDPKLVNHYARQVRKFTTTKVIKSFITDQEIKLPKVTIPAGVEVKCTQEVPLDLKIGWYSGRQELSKDIDIKNFNYIKLGPYIEEYGPLDNPNTNQRLYEIQMSREVDENGDPIYGLMDITNMFWK